MVTTASVARVAALLGDPARAAMMQALMDGRALTAGELAAAAGVTPQTASGHLAKLGEAGLVAASRQGRHRYHRLPGPTVASLVESLMLVAGQAAPAPPRTGPRDAALRQARTCYDHVAGRLGVALADALAARGWIRLEDGAGLVTPEGLDGLAAAGLDVEDLRRGRPGAPLCRPCLDWSERRPHLAGRLGAALCRQGLERGWIRRQAGSRALAITPEGRRAYRDLYGVEVS